MSYNASERKDVRRAEKDAKAQRIADRDIIRSLMSTTAGRSWVYRLLEATHIYQTSRRSTPHDTYFAEGERNVGLRLLTDLMSYCPELYLQMLQDANVKEAANDRRYSDDRSTTAAARSDGDAGGPVSEYDPLDERGLSERIDEEA